MPKKQKEARGLNAIMKHWVKPAMKASTHILTIGGTLLVVSPAARGVGALAQGNLAAAKDHILYDTTGQATPQAVGSDLFGSIKAALVNVGIPLALGIGLIAAGAQARKRIGN